MQDVLPIDHPDGFARYVASCKAKLKAQDYRINRERASYARTRRILERNWDSLNTCRHPRTHFETAIPVVEDGLRVIEAQDQIERCTRCRRTVGARAL